MLTKPRSVAVFLYAAILACAVGQNTPKTPQDELIAADRGIWQAIAGTHPNLEKVSSALAPDYIDIDSGVRNPRESVIDYLRGLTKFSFEYANPRAYILSPTSGYVIAELSYSSIQKGTAATGKVLTTTVFSKERGRWIAHLHTEMELKPAAR